VLPPLPCRPYRRCRPHRWCRPRHWILPAPLTPVPVVPRWRVGFDDRPWRRRGRPRGRGSDAAAQFVERRQRLAPARECQPCLVVGRECCRAPVVELLLAIPGGLIVDSCGTAEGSDEFRHALAGFGGLMLQAADAVERFASVAVQGFVGAPRALLEQAERGGALQGRVRQHGAAQAATILQRECDQLFRVAHSGDARLLLFRARVAQVQFAQPGMVGQLPAPGLREGDDPSRRGLTDRSVVEHARQHVDRVDPLDDSQAHAAIRIVREQPGELPGLCACACCVERQHGLAADLRIGIGEPVPAPEQSAQHDDERIPRVRCACRRRAVTCRSACSRRSRRSCPARRSMRAA
jgi:hypothetical protein